MHFNNFFSFDTSENEHAYDDVLSKFLHEANLQSSRKDGHENVAECDSLAASIDNLVNLATLMLKDEKDACPPLLVSSREVCRMLSVSPGTFNKLRRRQALKQVNLSRSVRFYRKDILELAEKLKTGKKP